MTSLKLCLVFLMLVSVSTESCRTTVEEKSGIKSGANIINDLVIGHPDIEEMFAFSGGVNWTKFVMTTSDSLPYFLNSNIDPLHYPYATAHIPTFQGLTASEFEEQTLHTQRIGISGNIFLSNKKTALSFVSIDKLSHDDAIKYLQAVAKHIKSENMAPLKFAYVPDDSSYLDVEQNSAKYGSAGFEIVKYSDLNSSYEVLGYSLGWGYGKLVRLQSSEVEKAFEDGRLRSSDILFTDKLNANFPILAGLITEEPAPPGAHPVMLARALSIPIAQVRDGPKKEKLISMIGKEIYLNLSAPIAHIARLSVHSIDNIQPEIRSKLEKLRSPTPLAVPTKASFKAISGRIYQPCKSINNGDQKYFGGKATNFRVLCDAIEEHVPKEAIGISFDVWDRFLSTKNSSGQTLKSVIDTKMSQLTFPPTNIVTWIDTLKDIQSAIITTKFPPDLKEEVVSVLKSSGFSDSRTIRFRSSTNVEDGAEFNGAGLYDSFSGCLGDEVSQSQNSLCGSKKPKPITEAIKKVFASFYNEKAVFARNRLKVNENSVGMALLVHYSFPDETELANGVLTTEPFSERENGISLNFFSHPNAYDVTDPAITTPSELAKSRVYVKSGQPAEFGRLMIDRYSGFGPIGKMSLGTNDHYRDLGLLAWEVQKQFEKFFELKKKPHLDMEFKIIQEADKKNLVVKQVRIIPEQKLSSKEKLVIGRKVPLCVAQIGGFEDNWNRLISNHFLKIEGHVDLNSGLINEITKSKSFIVGGELSFLRQPNASKFNFQNLQYVTSTYNSSSGTYDFKYSGSRSFQLGQSKHNFSFEIGALGLSSQQVIIASYPSGDSVGSGQLFIKVKSKNNETDLLGKIQNLEAYYYACDELGLESEISSYELSDGSVKAEISFQFLNAGFLKNESGLGRWVSVNIAGLTSQPFKIGSNAARTYGASHHNMSEFFLFEPALDPSIRSETIIELRTKNVRFILVEKNIRGQGTIRTIGFDHKVKKWAQISHCWRSRYRMQSDR